ncbi:MAG: TetR/AcrR family transcriptional regulator [Hyphomicrobium sp.]
MRNSTKLRARGRPRAFDPATAVTAARDTFARKGYAAATLDELCASMTINRPSLYAAFTDKETLYITTLRDYAGVMEQRLSAALASEADVTRSLKAFYEAAMSTYVTRDGAHIGCFVVATALAEAVQSERIKAEAKRIFDGLDHLLTQRFERALKEKQIRKDSDPAALARLVVGVLHSIAVRTRAGGSKKLCQRMADDVIALLPRTA